MEYHQQINNASYDTAKAMMAKGFHDDDIFMKDLYLLLPTLFQGRAASKGQKMAEKLAEVWTRNRKLARIALIHSELSEAVEGIRKDAMDDKLPHRKQEEVELADTLIRMEDYAGTYGLDLGGARMEKEAYNFTRAYKHGRNV